MSTYRSRSKLEFYMHFLNEYFFISSPKDDNPSVLKLIAASKDHKIIGITEGKTFEDCLDKMIVKLKFNNAL